jgi:hypothetical protein
MSNCQLQDVCLLQFGMLGVLLQHEILVSLRVSLTEVNRAGWRSGMLCTCVREMLGSNIGPDTGYPD